MAISSTLDERELDLYADLVVWCSDVDAPAAVVDGFCATCGARDHDEV